MEGVTIYEESKTEVQRILKTMGSDAFEINAAKLDTNTKEQLLVAINDVLSRRSREIDKVILGVNKQYYG
jgi:hypothetical protein